MICHSNQAVIACEESTLKLKERCASPNAKRVVFGQRPSLNSGQPSRGKAESQEGRKPSWRCQGTGEREKTEEVRRRQRRVRESFRGDGECAT
eukprot:3140795-Pleurochrysis_carterae.AAC.1